MDFIRVEGLEVECIVGLRPHERRRKQRVVVDLSLGLELSHAGRSGRIAHTCDYDQIADEVRELLKFRRYQLIEAATEEMAAMLLGTHRMVRTVRIRIVKPSALPGRARSASVEITRSQQDFERTTRVTERAALEVLLETREAGLYLAHVRPGVRLGSLSRAEERQRGWLISGALVDGERSLSVGDRVALPAVGDGYVAPAGHAAVVFICACPPLAG